MSRKAPISSIEPGDAVLRRRVLYATCGLFSAFSLLSWRLFHVQVERHDYYAGILERKHQRTDALEAHRGRIFDTRGHLLAGDEPVQRIVFDIGYLNQRDAMTAALEKCEGMKARDLRDALTLEEIRARYLGHVLPLLAHGTGRPREEIAAQLEARMEKRMAGEEVIAREVSVENGILLRAALEKAELGRYQELRGRIGAVIFRDSFARRYPTALPMFHLTGKLGEHPDKPGAEPEGISGVEKFYNERLKGTAGQRIIEVDGRGEELAAYRGDVIPPVHGANLRCTFDNGLQELVTRELDLPSGHPDELSVAEMKPDRVIVVLFEPKTMALRSVVTRDFTRNPEAGPLLTNDLCEYVYEPGSTIKIATIAAALTNGRVSPATKLSIDPDGDRYYDDEDIEPIRDEHAYPELTVEGIMIKSSNIGAYKLARQIGLTKFRQFIDDLGFARQTGLTLPLEQRGWFPKMWNMQSLSRSAYGYAYSVTPAQMCALMGCILNDGRWSPLRTAEAWTDEHGRAKEEIPLPETRQPVTEKAARQVRQMLIQVVEKGTAKLARSEMFEIGGKTGTANKWNNQIRDYDRRKQVVSFLGYISNAEGPQLAGIVIVDEPKLDETMNYGGRLAAPLFRRIAEAAMKYYEVPAQFAGTAVPGKKTR
jgi:cell division protein FtsI/penicillin-binding protein 2